MVKGFVWFVDWLRRGETIGRALKHVGFTVPTSGLVAYLAGTGAFERVLLFEATLAILLFVLHTVYEVVDRFGSTAVVRFVLDPGMEAKLHVTNRGPTAEFFASLWFTGSGTGGYPPLFAHWTDLPGSRIKLARGQTGVIFLGRMVRDDGVERWDLIGVDPQNTLAHVRPLAAHGIGAPVRDDFHAEVSVEVFAEAELVRPPGPVRVAFTDAGAHEIKP